MPFPLNQSLSVTRLISVTWRNVSIRSAPRFAPLRPLTRARHPTHLIRFKTTPSTPTTPTPGAGATAKHTAPQPNNAVYGPNLCIYHAGTGKVTFLACLKLSTLFLFVFFGFVVTPAYYQKEGLSLTVAGTALCAVAPLVFVAYITAPFVTFIHMRLPPFARQSEGMLRRYVRTPPPQMELVITTMSLIAKPRSSTVKLRDLRPASKRFGIVNMTRDTTAENAARKWYMYRAVGNFNVQRASGTSRAPWVWDEIWNHVNAK
ncbi:hypothetical protein F5B17DRAFT_398748 [Nemania serpens]|nr:hypothetical protein F5B17DRAFT_398748 [Nemania serpens]